MIKNKTIIDFYFDKSSVALKNYGFDPLMVKFFAMDEGAHTKGKMNKFLKENFMTCYSSHMSHITGEMFTVYAVQSLFIAN